MHSHFPSTHACPTRHIPQSPPQPSGPHSFPAQAGMHSHFPSTHACPTPQETPFVTGECTHPLSVAHESTVHGLESSHGSSSGAWMQPASTSHASCVQATPSSHSPFIGTATHPFSASQCSTVHAIPSSHAASLVEAMHPEAGRQKSVVQATPSSQNRPKSTCTQPPALASQWSMVHESPSLHDSSSARWVHVPSSSLHRS